MQRIFARGTYISENKVKLPPHTHNKHDWWWVSKVWICNEHAARSRGKWRIHGNHHISRRNDIWDKKEIEALRHANLKCENQHQKVTCVKYRPKIDTWVIALVDLMVCIFASLQKILMASLNPYPTAFPYGNGMVLHFYQQQESSTTKTVHKVINKGLKTYV